MSFAFFAAEVVEIVGSLGLEESFEAHLSDVLNGIPADKDNTDAPIGEVYDQTDNDATEANGTPVEGNIASDAVELGMPIVGDKVVPAPPSSSLVPSSIALF